MQAGQRVARSPVYLRVRVVPQRLAVDPLIHEIRLRQDLPAPVKGQSGGLDTGTLAAGPTLCGPQVGEHSRFLRIVRPGLSGVEQPTDEDLFHQVRLVAIDLLLAPTTQAIQPLVGFNLENRIDIAGQRPAKTRGRVPGQRGKDLPELLFGDHAGAVPSTGLRTGLLHNRAEHQVGQPLEALHAVRLLQGSGGQAHTGDATLRIDPEQG